MDPFSKEETALMRHVGRVKLRGSSCDLERRITGRGRKRGSRRGLKSMI